jgi:hypothetical protein
MECRLVMYQLGHTDLSNSDMLGKLKQDLGYIRFRRVPSKKGKSVFYLFFQSEKDTYKALNTAKKMKNISVVRYKHRNPELPPPDHLDEFPQEELPFFPFHPKKFSNITRCAFSKHFEKFASRV